MVQPGTDRRRFMNQQFFYGYQDATAANESADEIIASPDRFLLSQSDLFDAEGGWSTFALTMGLALGGVVAVGAMNPRAMSYLQSGQLKFREWSMLGGAAFAGGFVGNQIGINAFGNQRRYHDHWMAYTFVKSQNRYEGRQILGNAPTY